MVTKAKGVAIGERIGSVEIVGIVAQPGWLSSWLHNAYVIATKEPSRHVAVSRLRSAFKAV